jgi:hypothetical protein
MAKITPKMASTTAGAKSMGRSIMAAVAKPPLTNRMLKRFPKLAIFTGPEARSGGFKGIIGKRGGRKAY